MEIFTINTNDISEQELQGWYSAMSDERKTYADRAKSAADKKSRIAADRLARKAISAFCGISADEIVFSKTKSGKPYTVNTDVKFSISHSGDTVICAVSDNEIGADIEKIRPVHPRSAERFATESELEYINENNINFFNIWTLKEAYFKCIGTGLGADIKSVSFSVDGEEIACSESGYNLRFHDVAPGYVCAVCEKTN